MPLILNLKVRKYSVYRNGRIIQFDDGSDEALLLRSPISYIKSANDKLHTVVEGDRLDRIAFYYYSKVVKNAGHYWWVIADINGINNPLDLDSLVGTKLVIPDMYNIELRGR